MIWFIFNLRGKKIRHIYIVLQGFMTLLLCAGPLSMVLLEQQGVWLVLTRTGPVCPRAHSKLIFISPFPLVNVFIDTFTVFPMGAAWLGSPNLTCGATRSNLGF
jgi:hypothetical protein